MTDNTEYDPTIPHIFTDGACSGNPGPGGWAAVVIADGRITELGGGDRHTTNNRMEMLAVIEALKTLPDYDRRVVHTDSSYTINGITKWIHGWRRNGWKKKDGAPVLNEDLWRQLDQLNTRGTEWIHVAGHAGHYLNERCDTIAVTYSMGRSPKLRNDSLSGASDSGKIIAAILEKGKAPGKPGSSKSGSYKSKPKSKGPKKYLFAHKGKVYRFKNWPSCQAFSNGKGGWARACTSREEEEAYVKSRGLPVSSLNKVEDV